MSKKKHPPVPPPVPRQVSSPAPAGQQIANPVPAEQQIANPVPVGRKIALAKMEMVHSGPIPSALEMKQYAEVFSELPQRIVQMAEAEQQNRFEREAAERALQQDEQARNFRLIRYGIIASVTCVLMIMTAAVFCAMFGHPVTSLFIGSGGLGVIVTVLVCGSRLRNGTEKKG